MSAPLRFAFLMDPLEEVLVHHDTTFALMREAERRGHTVYSFEQPDLGFVEGRAAASMRQVRLRMEQGQHFEVIRKARVPLAEVDVLFLRKDPPVDRLFIHATQLVDFALPEGPFCVNPPGALRDANEKLFGLRHPELMPETLVSMDAQDIARFVAEHQGRAVLKPIDGFAGKGILFLNEGDANFDALIESSTSGGRTWVVVQAFVPASAQGDKRILLLDGEAIGAVLRVPGSNPRGNFARGASPARTTLTTRDKEIVSILGPDLRRRGLSFVGIDVIGDFLTEVNVTSPTGLMEINALEGVLLEKQVIDFAERGAAARENWPTGARDL